MATGGTLREQLRARILALAGVREARSRLGGNQAFYRGKREFAHFHGADAIDIRLPRPEQKPLRGDPRAVFRPRPSDWLELRFTTAADVELAAELARKAYESVPAEASDQ